MKLTVQGPAELVAEGHAAEGIRRSLARTDGRVLRAIETNSPVPENVARHRARACADTV